LVGKAAVLIALIWGLIQIYNHFKTSDYSISVHGDYSYFILPDSLKSELENPWVFSNLRSIWFFEIKNEGKKEIKDLQLELPFDGFCRIYPAGESLLDNWFGSRIMSPNDIIVSSGGVFSSFSRIIKVPSLRPSNIISVMAWGNVSASTAYVKDTKVTYSEGAYAISYPVIIRGWWGKLYTLNQSPPDLLFFCAIAAIFYSLSCFV
jgi:hypothetical protein